MTDKELNSFTEKLSQPLNKCEALAILYLEKQDIEGCTPEEVVTRFIDTHDRIVKAFENQEKAKKRRLNPLPL
jgi:ABC-type proline/glycine betaine transport system substrate-binding protein